MNSIKNRLAKYGFAGALVGFSLVNVVNPSNVSACEDGRTCSKDHYWDTMSKNQGITYDEISMNEEFAKTHGGVTRYQWDRGIRPQPIERKTRVDKQNLYAELKAKDLVFQLSEGKCSITLLKGTKVFALELPESGPGVYWAGRDSSDNENNATYYGLDQKTDYGTKEIVIITEDGYNLDENGKGHFMSREKKLVGEWPDSLTNAPEPTGRVCEVTFSFIH